MTTFSSGALALRAEGKPSAGEGVLILSEAMNLASGPLRGACETLRSTQGDNVSSYRRRSSAPRGEQSNGTNVTLPEICHAGADTLGSNPRR